MIEGLSQKEKKVYDAILKRLKKPNRKSGKKIVVGLVGIVGSGKTPVAEIFARELGAALVSGDDIRIALRKNKIGFDKVRDIEYELVKEVLYLGSNAVLDSDCADPHKQSNLKKTVKDAGGILYLVRVVKDLDVMIGEVINARYGTKDKDLYAGATTDWKGTKKPAVVKLREMSRRMPHHYTWSRDDGGQWVHKTISTVYASIDTTKSQLVTGQVRELARRLRN